MDKLHCANLHTADPYDAALHYSDFIINVFYHSRIDESKMTNTYGSESRYRHHHKEDNLLKTLSSAILGEKYCCSLVCE